MNYLHAFVFHFLTLLDGNGNFNAINGEDNLDLIERQVSKDN